MADKLSSLRRLDWDSEFFGKEIGHFESNEEIELNLNFADFELVQAKVSASNSTHIDNPSNMGFVFVEGELNFILDLTNNKYSNNFEPAVTATPNDINEICKIASNELQTSRYRAPWFSDLHRSNLYSTWAQKAVLGQYDDICLVAKDNSGSITGFATLKFHGQHARIGLITVDSRFRRQGVGKQLLASVIIACQKKGCDSLLVSTQMSNTAAIQAYAKAGFTPNSINYWFYRT
ncbi:GNAT family N-acetyltransferase [Pseudoalteromonas fenneropenaei]|uniref:GNAT family N-acetyltransferase n=1 Tax=Pseudoalteromonas fenneropenaei TaxID=1737459 RepID=A0ABV7CKD1_9GAMM